MIRTWCTYMTANFAVCPHVRRVFIAMAMISPKLATWVLVNAWSTVVTTFSAYHQQGIGRLYTATVSCPDGTMYFIVLTRVWEGKPKMTEMIRWDHVKYKTKQTPNNIILQTQELSHQNTQDASFNFDFARCCYLEFVSLYISPNYLLANNFKSGYR